MSQLQEQLQATHSSFTPAQARIAAYLLADPLNAALLTATELAQQVDVDPATVVRFAQKLGYKGYLALKNELAQLARNRVESAPPAIGSLGQALEGAFQAYDSDLRNLWVTIDKTQVIQLVELFAMPSHLLLLADAQCATIAAWLAPELKQRGFQIDTPGGDPLALADSMLSTQTYDRVLILEGSSPSPTLEHVTKELQHKKIRSFAILGSTASNVSHFADATLTMAMHKHPNTFTAQLQTILNIALLSVDRLHQTYQNNGPSSHQNDPQGPQPI